MGSGQYVYGAAASDGGVVPRMQTSNRSTFWGSKTYLFTCIISCFQGKLQASLIKTNKYTGKRSCTKECQRWRTNSPCTFFFFFSQNSPRTQLAQERANHGHKPGGPGPDQEHKGTAQDGRMVWYSAHMLVPRVLSLTSSIPRVHAVLFMLSASTSLTCAFGFLWSNPLFDKIK